MRGRILILSVLLVSIFAGFASAQEDVTCITLESERDSIVGTELPDKVPFKNEIMNVYIGEEVYGSLEISKGIVIDFSCLENENPTYGVYVNSQETVNYIATSEDILEAYEEKSASGELAIKGFGFGKKIKLAFVKLFFKFA